MQAMINTKELAMILNTTERNASKVIKQVNENITKQGGYVIKTRPPQAPKHLVYELLKLGETQDEKSI